ncbi:MAG: hypothetical protein CMB37_03205 [Euryarchaeota archaeon]|nr:hypothetical protein [Euryarchaeota archaeon]MEC7704652.1 ABA4-like family protein [Candidatus Thermoplasmatota archaeon]
MSTMTVLFWISSILILPFWMLMWFLPKHEITAKLLGNPWYCIAPLTVPYVLLVIPNLLDIFLLLGTQMPTPEIVLEMFDDDTTIMLAWLHMLALDTLAGRWIWKRMNTTEKPIWVSMPTLLLCMMVAPLGVLLGMSITHEIETKKQEMTA